MTNVTTHVPADLVAAVSSASRAVGELGSALTASPFGEAFASLLVDAGGVWPSLNTALEYARHDVDVFRAADAGSDDPAMFEALRLAAYWATAAVHQAEKVHQQSLDLVASERVSRYAAGVLELVLRRGEISAGTVVEELGVSPTTAGSVLERLTGLAIVEEITGRRRGRVFRYSPLLDCFRRPPISVVSTEVGQTGAMEEHHGAGGSLVSYVPAVVAAVFAGSDAQRVVVFGSVARGEHGTDSDIDLLVVLPHVDNAHDDAVRIMRLLRDMPVPIDVMVTDPERLVLQSKIPGIVRVALAEGRSFERAA